MGSSSGGLPEVVCFRVGGSATGWRVVLPVPTSVPIDVAALLRDNPDFLNSHLPGAPRVVALTPVRRTGGPGPLLCLAVDEDGGVLVAGLGRDSSRDAWTELVREVLSLSGRVWRMPLAAFVQPFVEAAGKSLLETAAAVVPPARAGTKFREAVEASLARGRFPVRLLARVEDDECRQAVGYLAAMNLDVVGLVPDAFQCSGVDVVVARPVVARLEPRPAPVERPQPAATPIPQPSPAPAQPRPSHPEPGKWQSNRPPTLSPSRSASVGQPAGTESNEGKTERNWPKLGGLGEPAAPAQPKPGQPEPGKWQSNRPPTLSPSRSASFGASPGSDDREGKTERNWPKLGGFDQPTAPATQPGRPAQVEESAQSAPQSSLSTRAPKPPSDETGKGPAPGTSPGTMSNKRPPKTGWGGLGGKKK
jgi:hypothetical protein